MYKPTRHIDSKWVASGSDPAEGPITGAHASFGVHYSTAGIRPRCVQFRSSNSLSKVTAGQEKLWVQVEVFALPRGSMMYDD
ncbi:hypothetical protein EJB05_08533, partial [Eragrostis curvula]